MNTQPLLLDLSCWITASASPLPGWFTSEAHYAVSKTELWLLPMVPSSLTWLKLFSSFSCFQHDFLEWFTCIHLRAASGKPSLICWFWQNVLCSRTPPPWLTPLLQWWFISLWGLLSSCTPQTASERDPPQSHCPGFSSKGLCHKTGTKNWWLSKFDSIFFGMIAFLIQHYPPMRILSKLCRTRKRIVKAQ